MRGVIWYHTKEKGKEFFNLIKEQYDKMDYECKILPSANPSSLPTVLFSKEDIYDMDSWTLLSDTYILNKNSHLEKWSYAYIDSEISSEYCNETIFPSLIRPPFQGFQVY